MCVCVRAIRNGSLSFCCPECVFVPFEKIVRRLNVKLWNAGDECECGMPMTQFPVVRLSLTSIYLCFYFISFYIYILHWRKLCMQGAYRTHTLLLTYPTRRCGDGVCWLGARWSLELKKPPTQAAANDIVEIYNSECGLPFFSPLYLASH